MNNSQKDSIYNNYQTNNQTFNQQSQTNEQPYRVENTPASKKMLRVLMIISLVATIALVGGFALVYTGVIKVDKVGPESILLNASNIGVKKGKSYQYDYQVYPESSTAKNVYYESSDPSVAEVNPTTGYITPIKEGTTTISIKSTADDTVIEKSNLSVTKEKVSINDIKLSSERIVFDLSNKTTSQLLKVLTEPYNATNQDLSFTSSDESVAIVDQSGRVYPVGFGMATIAVRAKDGNASATCEVIVTDSKNKKVYFELPDKTKLIFPYSIQLETNYLKLRYGTTRKVGFILLPPDVTEDVVTWISSDPNVATVKEGLIEGVAVGTTTITARTVNDLVATLTVDVTDEEVTSDYVTFPDDTDKLSIGESKRLTVNYDPNATVANFEWTSSNPDVISVDSEGNVTALAKGKAVITVKPSSETSTGVQEMSAKKMASKIGDSIVIVSDGVEAPSYLTVTESTITIGTGETRKLEAESDTGNNKFIYQSMNEEVATVNEDGVIYGLSVGTTEIKISSANGVSVNVTVNVAEVAASKLTISAPSGTTIKKGSTIDLTAEVWPKNATEKTIVWSSSNPNVATVTAGGSVYGKANGQATITAAVGAQSNSIVIKVANEASSETVTPTKKLSDIEIEALKKTPIIFERESDTKVKLSLDLESQGYTDYVTLSKTTFKIVSKDNTISNAKLSDINKKLPLSKNLTFKSGSYGNIQIRASVYLPGNKKTIELEPASYKIGEEISVEFSVPVGSSVSLGSYFTVGEANKATDWVLTNEAVAKISEGYIEGVEVGTTYITGHSNGYTFIAKVSVIDDNSEEEIDSQKFTFLYDTCYAASDLCKTGTLTKTTLTKNTSKCTSEKPYYVAKQKTNYEFTCKVDKKKTTYSGLSTYTIIDKELSFDHTTGSNISKGETRTIKISNWSKLGLASATVTTSTESGTQTIKKNSFKVSAPASTEAKSITITVEGKTSGKNPKVYKGVLVLNVSEEFVPGSIECENGNKLTLTAGKDKILSCFFVDKYDATRKQQIVEGDNPTFKTSDKKIATVDSTGKVLAVKKGSTKIKVTANKLKVNVNITVEKAPTVYNYLGITLKQGKTAKTKVSVVDNNLTLSYSAGVTKDSKNKVTSGLTVTYTSSNTEVLTIEDNKVTPISAGTATITGTYVNAEGNEVKGTLDVTVTEQPAKIDSLDCGPNMYLVNGEEGITIDCRAHDSANNKDLGVNDNIFTYTVGDSKIVSIDKNTGVVTPKKVGSTTIKVKANGYKTTATVKVKVQSGKASYTDIRFTNLDDVSLKKGATYDVTYELVISETEKQTSDPKVKIKSKNTKIISVKDNKTLKALAKGTATIVIEYTNPDSKVPLTKEAKVTVYVEKTCYRYKKITTKDYDACKEGYGYLGTDESNCYKIVEAADENACTINPSTGKKISQRRWTNGYCLDINSRYANTKSPKVAENYTYTSKLKDTNGNQYDEKNDKLICQNTCSDSAKCTVAE